MAMLMRWALILALSLTGFAGCTSKDDDSSSESKVEKATAAIDQGDFDQAINLLSEVKKTEDTPKVSMVLASAYAGRAGIKIEDFWGLVLGYEPLLNPIPAKETDEEASVWKDLKAATEVASSASPKARELLKSVNEDMQKIMRWKKRIETVPYVDLSHRHDLQLAVNVLNGVPTQGAHLYRAVLELILLRSGLDDVAQKAQKWSQKPSGTCSSAAKNILDWVTYCQGTLGNLLIDLGEAFPDDREDLQTFSESVNSFSIPRVEQLCGSGS